MNLTRLALVVVLCTALALSGCDGSESSSTDGGAPVDSSTLADTGFGVDASVNDGGADAGIPDAGTDGGADAGATYTGWDLASRWKPAAMPVCANPPNPTAKTLRQKADYYDWIGAKLHLVPATVRPFSLAHDVTLEADVPEEIVPDLPEPTVEELLAEELGDAVTNDDVIDAVLTAAGHYVRRVALFVVQGDHVAGWGARPEPPGDLRKFRLPLSEASVFATLRDTEGFYVGTYMNLPSTVRVLRALGSDGIGTMAVVPVTLKKKTVLYLWGESESYTRPPSVPTLKRLAAMMATGLEIVRLKSRLFTL